MRRRQFLSREKEGVFWGNGFGCELEKQKKYYKWDTNTKSQLSLVHHIAAI